MTAPRLLTTALFASAFPVLLLTTLITRLRLGAGAAALVIALVIAVAAGVAAVRARNRLDLHEAGIAALAADRLGPGAGTAAASIAVVGFTALQTGAYALLGMLTTEAFPALTWWEPAAGAWAAATLLAWVHPTRAARALPGTLWVTLWAFTALTFLTVLQPGIGLLGWNQANGFDLTRVLRPATGLTLAIVILGYRLTIPSRESGRRGTRPVVAGLAAVLATAYLGATVLASTRLGPGPLGADPETWPSGLPGPGPVTFPTAEAIVSQHYEFLGADQAEVMSTLWQWPVLAALFCAVILFGQQATDHAHALRRSRSTNAAQSEQLTSYPPASTQTIYAVGSGLTLLALAASEASPRAVYYLATTIGTLGLLLLTALTIQATAAVHMDPEPRVVPWRRTRLSITGITCAIAVAAGIAALPLLTARPWTSPVTWICPAVYALTAGVTVARTRWVKTRHPDAYQQIRRRLTRPQLHPGVPAPTPRVREGAS